MTAVELFILGRKLVDLAERALPQGNLGTSVRLVLLDIAFHPQSSISEITRRTGFLQSHVSSSVARLRELGVVETEIDLTDRRRTLVHVDPSVVERGARLVSVPIEEVLAPALGEEDGGALKDVVAALELLSERLTPKARAGLRCAVAT